MDSPAGKESDCNAGDPDLIPGSESSTGEGIGYPFLYSWGFLGGSDSKESTRNAGDLGSIPGLGRCPGGGHDNPLQYSSPANPLNRRAWRGPWDRKKLGTTERLSTAQHVPYIRV